MAFDLTETAKSALTDSAKEPNLVVKIEGLETLFGASPITKFIYVGDTHLDIGNPEIDPDAFYVGSQNLVANQDNAVTPGGTSTAIRHSLDIDKGKSTSIQNMSVAIMDNGFGAKLISPGVLLDDILQRRCLVYYGFNGTAYPDDYAVIFRGRVTDVTIDAGKIALTISSPDDQTRNDIFKKYQAKTTADIDDETAVIPIDDLQLFRKKVLGPDGTYDPAFESFVRIEDEIIQYDSIVAGALTGVVRGALNSIATPHSSGQDVSAYYRLKDNGVLLALKLMSSGRFDETTGAVLPYLNETPVTSVNAGGDQIFSNALFFRATNVEELFGVTVGDYLSTAGSSHASNNVSGKRVLDIVRGNTGDFVIVSNVNFVNDVVSSALTATFTSQYATLPDGCQLFPDEIDTVEHLRIYKLFLSSVQYDFYIKDGIQNAKEFLETQVYLPMAAYSLPRKSRQSVGYHIGPIPGQDITTFSAKNIKNPKNVQIKRGMNKNFFNEIVYKFDEDAVLDVFKGGYIAISQTSKNRIKNSPNKTLTIESKGLRSTDLAQTIAEQQSLRRLKRYQFGAETFVFSALLEDGFKIEVGDIIIFDGEDLFLADIKTGKKGTAPRLLEVQEKNFTLKTGDIQFQAVDTNFDGAARYCLISPSSIIQSGTSTTSFLIKPSFSKSQGDFEYRKWQKLTNCAVKIRNADFSIVGVTRIVSASSNEITVSPALAFTPAAGMIMELADYDSSLTTDQVKLIYGFMKNAAFADGKTQYQML